MHNINMRTIQVHAIASAQITDYIHNSHFPNVLITLNPLGFTSNKHQPKRMNALVARTAEPTAT